MLTHTHLRILYVDLVTINKVAAFHYDGRGILQFVRTVPDSGKAPCWAMSITPHLRFFPSGELRGPKESRCSRRSDGGSARGRDLPAIGQTDGRASVIRTIPAPAADGVSEKVLSSLTKTTESLVYSVGSRLR